jgi:hypothetical protein
MVGSRDPEMVERVSETIRGGGFMDTQALAMDMGISEMEFLRNLPPRMVAETSKDNFDDIMEEVTDWGRLTTIVRNGSVIMEISAPFPTGAYGHGYFNLHGGASPISGHIRASRMLGILFVSMPLMGMECHSIQFFDEDGAAMFKLYLGRNEKREILPDQLEKYRSLRDGICDGM